MDSAQKQAAAGKRRIGLIVILYAVGKCGDRESGLEKFGDAARPMKNPNDCERVRMRTIDDEIGTYGPEENGVAGEVCPGMTKSRVLRELLASRHNGKPNLARGAQMISRDKVPNFPYIGGGLRGKNEARQLALFASAATLASGLFFPLQLSEEGVTIQAGAAFDRIQTLGDSPLQIFFL